MDHTTPEAIVKLKELRNRKMLRLPAWTVAGILAAAALATFTQAQVLTPIGNLTGDYIESSSLQPLYRRYAEALGPRLKTPGKEQVVLSGTLTRKSGASQLTIRKGLTGKLRLEETGGKGRVLTFDGAQLRGNATVDQEDDDLVESLSADTAEQFAAHVVAHGAIRLLGLRFRVQGETGFGREVDIFETVSEVRSRRDKTVRVKHVMFDTASGLIRQVRYAAGAARRVTTLYGNYSDVDGHMVPGEIRRLENGQEVFRFTKTSAALQAANISIFERP